MPGFLLRNRMIRVVGPGAFQGRSHGMIPSAVREVRWPFPREKGARGQVQPRTKAPRQTAEPQPPGGGPSTQGRNGSRHRRREDRDPMSWAPIVPAEPCQTGIPPPGERERRLAGPAMSRSGSRNSGTTLDPLCRKARSHTGTSRTTADFRVVPRATGSPPEGSFHDPPGWIPCLPWRCASVPDRSDLSTRHLP